MSGEHITVNEQGYLLCKHCGGTSIIHLPISVESYLRRSKWFTSVHKDCAPVLGPEKVLAPGDTVGYVTKDEDDWFCLSCARIAAVEEGYTLDRETGPGGMLNPILRSTAVEQDITCWSCSKPLAGMKGE